MNLSTDAGGVRFETPLLLASGYISETPEFFTKARRFGCASMVTRSLKMHVPPERARVPAPRYVVPSLDSMLNCEWGNERPWTSWRDGWVRQVQSLGAPIVVSLSGRDIDSCVALIGEFDRLGVDAFEINISCAHSGALHGNLNIDFDHLRRVLGRIRPITTTPIWIKLSYSPWVVTMATEAVSNGANAIVCMNTLGPGLLLDIETGQPKLGIKNGAGGLSGRAIFPIALASAFEISKAINPVPVIGVGGVSNSEDVIQMLMAGARAVQLYTAPALRGPIVYKEIMDGLTEFLGRHTEYRGDVRNLIGVSHRYGHDHCFEAPSPVVSAERCTGCAKCYPSCAFDAIDFVRRGEGQRALAVINDKCIGCNACIGACPPEFTAISTSYRRGG